MCSFNNCGTPMGVPFPVLGVSCGESAPAPYRCDDSAAAKAAEFFRLFFLFPCACGTPGIRPAGCFSSLGSPIYIRQLPVPLSPEGSGVGSGVGSTVGSGVGSAVGSGVGSAVGSGVGSAVGSGVGVGVGVGDGLGDGSLPPLPSSGGEYAT